MMGYVLRYQALIIYFALASSYRRRALQMTFFFLLSWFVTKLCSISVQANTGGLSSFASLHLVPQLYFKYIHPFLRL